MAQKDQNCVELTSYLADLEVQVLLFLDAVRSMDFCPDGSSGSIVGAGLERLEGYLRHLDKTVFFRCDTDAGLAGPARAD